ncbi:MAG: hypothetical protein QOE63_401 [Acidimicrobiaceae bacterium]
MKRLLALLACVLLFGAACTKPSGTRLAATVNGEEITNQSVVDELNAVGGNEQYLADLEQSLLTKGKRVKGDAAGSYDGTYVSGVLQTQITYAVVHQEVVRRGLVADDSCKASALQDVYSTMGKGDTDAGKTVLAKFPQSYQGVLVSRDTDTLILQAALLNLPCVSGDAAKAYYDAHQSDFDQTCLAGILVTDPTKVDAIMAQLRGGADFATVAQASSDDPTTQAKGGDLGCHAASEFSPGDPKLTAPVGQLLDPVQSAQGTAILKVTDRKSPAYADVASQAEELAATAAGQAISQWFVDSIKGAVITVDARYGTWDPQQGVVPPASATTTTVAPSSDSGASIVTVPDTSSS